MSNAGLRARLRLYRRQGEVGIANLLGLSPTMARDVRREVLWWLFARREAIRNRRGLLCGSAIGWTSTGYAELLPVEIPRPGRGRVTIEVDVSAVSAGTERARYLRLPNTSMGLAMPGYSASGTVIEVGPGVDAVRRGDSVAVAGHGVRHASLATVPARAVYRIPAGVSREKAALVRLGIICGQGVRSAALAPGERFCVIGAGSIGLLAGRIAVARGGVCAAVVARSRSKEPAARTGGAEHFLLTGPDDHAIVELRCALVIEATGDPEAVSVAVSAAAEGGRVILLGSPRGVTSDLPVEEIRRKRLRLIGAHERTLELEAQAGPSDPEREEGEAFLKALSEGRLDAHDLIGDPVDPREAGAFYRQLVNRRDFVGGHFDWRGLPERERVARGHLLRPPDLAGRGLDSERRPLRPRRARRSKPNLLTLDDPFAGATGRLRIGMLGCGEVAMSNAEAALAAPNTELVACYDPAEGLAQGIADTYGGEVARSSEALIEHSAVDAVFICVPHHLHGPLAREALRADKHVIIEKPLAHSLADAVQTVEAAEGARRALAVSFPFRYEPNVILARRMIQAGALGELEGSHVRLLMEKPPPYWVGGFTGRSVSDWRASRAKAGGGVLIMNMSHYLDLLRHLSGVEVETLLALGGSAEEPAEVEDSISVAMAFANGAMGSLVGASAVRGTIVTSTELRVWGRDGHIVVEPRAQVYTLRAVDGLHTGRWQRFGSSQATARHLRSVFLSRLATAIDQGRPPEVSAADGLAAQAFIEASYRSSESGLPVSPSEVLEEARR